MSKDAQVRVKVRVTNYRTSSLIEDSHLPFKRCAAARRRYLLARNYQSRVPKESQAVLLVKTGMRVACGERGTRSRLGLAR